MKYFVDLEFIEDGKTIEIISLAAVCEDGREFYAENSHVDWKRAHQWVIENVKPHLFSQRTKHGDCFEGNAFIRDGGKGGFDDLGGIARDLRVFCNPEVFGKPEFWGYYSSYDWVAICQMYGPMIDKPEGWPMYCMDIKQLAVSLGNPQLPKQSTTEHHALADARWNKEAYEFLIRQQGKADQ